jgi:hypothetical protein
VSLARRLARLEAGVTFSSRREAARGEASSVESALDALSRTDPVGVGVGRTELAPERPPEFRRASLEELRRQLDALLERSQLLPTPTARTARRRPPLEELPFVRQSTCSGPLWQRIEPLPSRHVVGNVALTGLRAADPRVLAELALDPSVAASDPASWLFLDTETTGFAGAGTLAFLVGMAGRSASGELVVEQLLLGEPDQERPLLERVAERVQASSLIVSFNGKAFDRPLLEGRYLMNGLPPLPPRPHFDLLHVARRLHQSRLGRCNLKRIEMKVLGFDRGSDIDGSQVAELYGRFLHYGEAAGVAQVVSHNFFDVVSMLGMVSLYGQRCPELEAEDLAGLARTLRRAGATREAERAADAACERGGGPGALRVRAELAKARGDALGAIRDLELLCRQVDDPEGRLELAKLYEHQVRHPARALEWLDRGTAESSEAVARRRRRLRRKLGLEPGSP